jgi:hypothetical protein
MLSCSKTLTSSFLGIQSLVVQSLRLPRLGLVSNVLVIVDIHGNCEQTRGDQFVALVKMFEDLDCYSLLYVALTLSVSIEELVFASFLKNLFACIPHKQPAIQFLAQSQAK